jgi:hypothetical protein
MASRLFGVATSAGFTPTDSVKPEDPGLLIGYACYVSNTAFLAEGWASATGSRR